MQSLARDSGQGEVGNSKQSTQDSAAKYWCCCNNGKFKRKDGSIGNDKTKGFKSRVKYKETIRNANRAITKRARQLLKRQMLNDAETDH